MDGLFELVFILIIVIASIADAMGRKRKKRRRMEEMEREDAGSTGSRREADYEHRSPDQSPSDRTAGGVSGHETEERETADQMVPEDFWAILTGEAPPEKKESQGSRSEEIGAKGAGGEDDSRGLPEQFPERRQDPDPVPERRPDPTPPRTPHIPVPVPQDRYSETEEVTTRDDRSISETAPPEVGYTPRRTPPPLEGRRQPGAIHHSRGRRSSPASTYTDLLKAGKTDDLRKAIVLREVLGPPAALRSPDDR